MKKGYNVKSFFFAKYLKELMIKYNYLNMILFELLFKLIC